MISTGGSTMAMPSVLVAGKTSRLLGLLCVHVHAPNRVYSLGMLPTKNKGWLFTHTDMNVGQFFTVPTECLNRYAPLEPDNPHSVGREQSWFQPSDLLRARH